MSNTNTHPSDRWAALAFTRADRLNKALEFAGISNHEIADDLGLSRQTIGNYTSGRTSPSKPTVMAWAIRTGVPFEWLQTGILPTNPENEETPPTPKGGGLKLPELDSNQQPAGKQPAPVIALPLRPVMTGETSELATVTELFA